MSKKIIMCLAVALFTCLSVVAKPKDRPYTNLYDKLPASGYTGFVSLEVQAPGAFANSSGANYGITTSHGVMLKGRYYVGGGLGYIHDFGSGYGLIPIFGEGKLYFPSQFMRRIYPHIGARIGGQLATKGAGGDVFVQLAGGIRVPFSDRFAINLEVGPQLAGKYEREKDSQTILNYNKPYKAQGYHFQFFARVGFEF